MYVCVCMHLCGLGEEAYARACVLRAGEYDLFEDSGLHSAEVLSAIPDSFPVLLEARL